MEEKGTAAPGQELQRLYADAEKRTAKAVEELVAGESFGELLARATGNVMAVMRIGNDVADLVLRNLGLAGRRDIAALGRQLARNEDKLEMVLQEVERLRELQAEEGATNGRAATAAGKAPPAGKRS
jgi:hypothetical protein